MALPPTEIETSYTEHQILILEKVFTYACRHVALPARFSDEMIGTIQTQAEQLFSLFGMYDVARFDGWVWMMVEFGFLILTLSVAWNRIVFISTSRRGHDPCGRATYIVKNAFRRYGISDQNLIPTEESRRMTGQNKRESP